VDYLRNMQQMERTIEVLKDNWMGMSDGELLENGGEKRAPA
jgi:hypothetical protein